MKYRAAVATLAAVPLALGLAACGNSDPKATGYRPSIPAETPTAVTTKTAPPIVKAPAARLNRVTFVPAMNSALTKQKSWRIVGKMTVDGTTVMTMDGFQTAKPPAASLTMTGGAFGGKSFKVLAIGKTAYLSIPGMTPAGKYLKVTGAQAGDVGQMLDGGDPTKIVKSFGGGVGSVNFVRSERIDGELLDRYDVSISTAKALNLQGRKLPAGAPRTITYKLWMDKSHLVRRMTFELEGLSMVMTMSDYNKPVHITTPPASKIVTR
ncbi:hypothetical protein [Kribbella pratensis]|uniref:Lipoprotein LprG n=1 Tax=Kribbella pratensis TaxID=2512112 RepID=A0A4R8BSZ9_9ACTN|nr:hypothetical protein [Kribbella pratensis]TDW60952.1 hypothetical protein EV653_7512 [Kribbella pratensis]